MAHSAPNTRTPLISSQTNGVNSHSFQFDTEGATLPPSSNGSTPLYGDYATPGSNCSAFSDGIDAPEPFSALLGGGDPEIEREQPSLPERPSRLFGRYYYATISPRVIPPPIKVSDHDVLEGEEGEEELSSASSAEQADESTSPLTGNMALTISERAGEEGGEDETAAGAPADDLQCPGISGQDEAERNADLAKLLKIAGEDGAEARRLGLGKMIQNGDTSQCTECGKTERRDRLLAHVVFRHLGLKTWACPLCRQSYSTRNGLAQHLKAIKVACLCGGHITRNNWYEHAKICIACLAVAGSLGIKKGRVVVQPTVAQARPTVRARRRRPAVGQNTSKKRKTLEFDGDGIKEERKLKRIKRDPT